MLKKYLELYVYIPIKHATGYALFSVINAIFSALLVILQVYVVSGFIDTSIKSYTSNSIDNTVYVWMLLLVLIVAYEWLIHRVDIILKLKAEVNLLKNYRMTLVDKAAKLDYRYIEDSNSWDLISRVLSSTENKILNNFGALVNLGSLIVRIIGIILVVAKYVWWSALLIAIFCIPLFIFSIKGGKANYNAARDASKYERKYNYLHSILVNRENVEERNVFDYEKEIDKKYSETNEKAFWITIKTTLIWVLKTRISGGLTSVAALIIILTLIEPTLNNTLTVGMFISLVNSIFQLKNELGYGLSSSMDAIVQGREYVKDIDDFMNMDELEDANCLPKHSINIEKIEFKNVSFKYPGTDNYIIKKMDLSLEKGKHYAFVGVNGAGKTTAIKLLTGLYPSYEGKIFINGKELKEYSQAEIKGMFSVVYQDFAKYYLTLKENISLGDVNNIDEYYKEIERINHLIDSLELRDCINDLAQGLDTPLGKIEQNSVDLSGGQWQRVAMVRALLNPATVRVLDEPTAALDPIMESKMYELFRNTSDDKMTIFISHRLGSIKIADEIFVFDNGNIAEKGTFEEVMSLKGIFYEMYDKQRGWYNE